MPEYAWFVVYSCLIMLVSLLGGHVPFLGKITHNRLQLYLSISAGVMLGASFFHVMPEAFELSKKNFGWWMSLGVVGLFCIERFIAPHSHELDGGHRHEHGQGQGAQTDLKKDGGRREERHHDHDHHSVLTGHEHRAAAPSIAGWMAVLGLTIHTFMNGVGLAGAVTAHFDPQLKGQIGQAVFPGLAMFLAIVLHKPADALAISTVLSRRGTSRTKIMLVQFGFALMVPAGVIALCVAQTHITQARESELTGAALAFSAGTFLFIALSDLLPEVQFHKHDRIPLFLALIVGVAFMGGIAYLEGDEDAKPGAADARAAAVHPGRP